MEEEKITQKAILAYDLTDIDAKNSFHNAIHVDDFLYALEEIRTICRGILKHGTNKTIEQVIEQISATACETLSKAED